MFVSFFLFGPVHLWELGKGDTPLHQTVQIRIADPGPSVHCMQCRHRWRTHVHFTLVPESRRQSI